MSKAILVFDLPEESCESMISFTAMEWALAIQAVDSQIRDWLKYGHSFLGPEDTMDRIRKLISEELESRHISLDMII